MPIDQRLPPEHYLDPQMARYLAEQARVAALYGDRFDTSIPIARAAIEAAQKPFNAGGPVMAAVTDRWIPINGRRALLRHYQPTLDKNLPVIVFLHGGGWTWFSIDTHDRLAREYAARTGCAVVAPDYALSPEYPFPIPLLECVQVLEWLHEHGESWGMDGTRIAVCGDSAGANLALAATMMLREAPARPRAALLGYGVYDQDYERESYRWIGESSLSPQTWKMKWFWQNYLQTGARSSDWRAVPILGEFAGLPPMLLQVGRLDVLHDENLVLAARARAEGVDAVCLVYPGMVHGFLRAVGWVDEADKALTEGAAWLRDRLFR